MLPTLDARLSAAAELVCPGQPVADIGCDHGKLTAVLAASGKYPKVIGADLRPGPLAKAAQTLEYAGCKDRAELRLGDGLSVLSPGEVSTIVLAGVSAQTTWEIIEKAPWVSAPGGPRLVMVPATRHSDLRRWLWEHGFALAADRPVQAAGRWYAVMAGRLRRRGVPCAGDAGHHPRGGGRGRPEGLRAHRVPPPGHLLAPQKAEWAGRGLPAGEKRYLGDLYAHESRCRRGRRQ